ncbi:hypothetical protein [Streptococcus sp. 27098_8_76]|uniref:hypothetical protein n=1 Tax=Streptococcus sp. 27098_8_76 TaxID=3003658 RepID=UPI00290115FA|nr:hypothetical protein [Streptococcus salivarius]
MTNDVFYSRNRAVLIDKINDTIRNSGLTDDEKVSIVNQYLRKMIANHEVEIQALMEQIPNRNL